MRCRFSGHMEMQLQSRYEEKSECKLLAVYKPSAGHALEQQLQLYLHVDSTNADLMW